MKNLVFGSGLNKNRLVRIYKNFQDYSDHFTKTDFKIVTMKYLRPLKVYYNALIGCLYVSISYNI